MKYVQALMAACLAVMTGAVFLNVLLRYGFGSGIAASEELSRLLFVWMVFIGATAAYPVGEHMAFTSIVASFQNHPKTMAVLKVVIRLLVVATCVLLGHGAWQQVEVGMASESVVMVSCVMLGRGAWQQVEVGLSSNSVVLGYPNCCLLYTSPSPRDCS